MKSRILAIDDDDSIRFTIETIGSYAGWMVCACHDIPSALEAWSSFRPDVVLLDYHLPLCNGLDALPKLRQVDPYPPIVMLTVEDDHDLAAQCRAAGASDFSLKPIKALDLIARINLNLELARLKRAEPMAAPELKEKGLNQEIITLLLAWMSSQEGFFAINEVAEALRLGYSTTHRYLNYLEQQGLLRIRHAYGKQGRPRKEYGVASKEHGNTP